MRKGTFKYIESQLYHYYENKTMIDELEKDIIFGRGGNDENVGGGKSNMIVSTIENSVIKLDSDKKLYNIRQSVLVIDAVLEHISEPYRKLVQMKYFSKRNYSWVGICEKLHVSRRTGFYMRKKVIEEIADRMGLI